MTNLKNIILDTVEKNSLTMIPKWKFVLYSILGVIGIFFVALLAVFSLSLILFVLSRYGFMDMPFFGFVHTIKTLGAIPVPLFLCSILLLLGVEVLTRHYAFSFRRPLVVTLLLTTLLVVLISFAISQTPIHEHVREYAKTHHMDVISRAYDRPVPFKRGAKDFDVLRGEVLSIGKSTVTLKLFDGQVMDAHGFVPEDFKRMTERVVVGDDVALLGSFKDGAFEMKNIRPASPMFFKGGRIEKEGRVPPLRGGEINIPPRE